MVTLENIKFRYKTAFHSNGFEFVCRLVEFKPGYVSAIVGPNGTGKSTALNVIAGHRNPDAGTVSIGLNENRRRIKSNAVGYIDSQDKDELANELRVIDYVAALGAKSGRSKLAFYYNSVEVDNLAFPATAVAQQFLNSNIYKRICELSSGQRQFLTVLLQAMGTKDILLADEPTVFLDIDWSNAIFDLLSEIASTKNIPVVIVTHDLELLSRRSAEIFLMDGGMLAHVSDVDHDSLSTAAKIIYSVLEA